MGHGLLVVVFCAESATDFAISLLQSLVTDESSVISELHSLVDALAKVAILTFFSVCCVAVSYVLFLFSVILFYKKCQLMGVKIYN